MILPIIGYGDPVLKKVAVEIDRNYPDLNQLLENMYETMYGAKGVGLAAPQVGLSIRLFIVDARPFAEDAEYANQGLEEFRKVFINPVMLHEEGTPWVFNEGCLSLPDIREDVERLPEIRIKYLDQNFKEKEESFKGIAARIIQHEYDHIEGRLFIDRISPIRKKMLQKDLDAIARGEVKMDYKIKYYSPKKRR